MYHLIHLDYVTWKSKCSHLDVLVRPQTIREIDTLSVAATLWKLFCFSYEESFTLQENIISFRLYPFTEDLTGT